MRLPPRLQTKRVRLISKPFCLQEKHLNLYCAKRCLISDIDECVASTHDCAKEARCVNKPGSFECTCREGYQGDGKTCRGM